MLIFRLSNLANVLRSAFRGGDIEWWDQEDTDTDIMQDEGSGLGDFYGEYSDDEDGFGYNIGDNTEGSGDFVYDSDDEDDIIVPAWTKKTEAEKVDEKFNPWPKNPPTLTPSTTTTIRPSSGTSSVHLRNKVDVLKAVITYVLPVATCYFGGFLTDVPWILQ